MSLPVHFTNYSHYDRCYHDLIQAKTSLYTTFNIILTTENPSSLNLNELERMAKRIYDATIEIQENICSELERFQKKECCHGRFNRRKITQVVLSFFDSSLVLAGGVSLFFGTTATQVLGSLLIVAGQAFSKVGDLSSICAPDHHQKREKFTVLYHSSAILIDSAKSVHKLIMKYKYQGSTLPEFEYAPPPMYTIPPQAFSYLEPIPEEATVLPKETHPQAKRSVSAPAVPEVIAYMASDENCMVPKHKDHVPCEVVNMAVPKDAAYATSRTPPPKQPISQIQAEAQSILDMLRRYFKEN